MQREKALSIMESLMNSNVGPRAEGREGREQLCKWLRTNPVIKPEACVLTVAQMNFGGAPEVWKQLTQGRPNNNVKVVRITEVSTYIRGICRVEPALPIGGWLLKKLSKELGE